MAERPRKRADPEPSEFHGGGGRHRPNESMSPPEPTLPYPDRREAGRILAEHLRPHAHDGATVVLGLPRGGVPVAYEVAGALELPLDVFVVRKLGVPGHEELAMGAIASGGVRVINAHVLAEAGGAQEAVDRVAALELQELERREALYRSGRPTPDLRGRTIILVDDGLATGATMRAAVAALRQRGVARIVAAVPVGSSSACSRVREEADEMICPALPEPFFGVGQFYEDFSQTPDDEVRALLAKARGL